MPRFFLACIAIFLFCNAAACRPKQHERARVAVSIFPIYDLARRIAGEDADVSLVLPPGQSPHGARPSPEGAQAVARAKVIVSVGLGVDDWMDPLVASADPKARVLKVGDRVPTRQTGDATDPHVWLDPQRARLIATAIVEELARADASHATAFRKRAEALDASLASLDKELEARTGTWASRGFVSFHASFGYYAERYRLDVLGVVEKTPGVEPSEAERSAITAVVASHKLRAIFREPQLPAAPAEAIARDARATLSVLDPIGGASTEVESYEALLRFDTAALESVLATPTR